MDKLEVSFLGAAVRAEGLFGVGCAVLVVMILLIGFQLMRSTRGPRKKL